MRSAEIVDWDAANRIEREVSRTWPHWRFFPVLPANQTAVLIHAVLVVRLTYASGRKGFRRIQGTVVVSPLGPGTLLEQATRAFRKQIPLTIRALNRGDILGRRRPRPFVRWEYHYQ